MHVVLEIVYILLYNIRHNFTHNSWCKQSKVWRYMSMYIYIDESGSVNNHLTNEFPYFVIALVHVKNTKKMKHAYKRFVASHLTRLKELDVDKVDYRGRIISSGGKMFDGDKFKELKGSKFDYAMKCEFLDYFLKKQCFEVFFIKIVNGKLSDAFCTNTARVFNYPLKLALEYYICHGLLPNEECILQLDERNERTETRHFLAEYLNTELIMNGSCTGPFRVSYFDSANNDLIQIADVYANCFYSQLLRGSYTEQFAAQEEAGIVHQAFEFPLGR